MVEGEEQQLIEVCTSCLLSASGRHPHPQFTAAFGMTGEVDSCSIGKDELVSDKDRVGKVLVGSIEGFVQLVPDVSATVIGVNIVTLIHGRAICTEWVFLGSTATDKD